MNDIYNSNERVEDIMDSINQFEKLNSSDHHCNQGYRSDELETEDYENCYISEDDRRDYYTESANVNSEDLDYCCEECFSDGIEEGYNEGYEEGVVEGINARCERAYEKGYRDGYEKAKQEVLAYIKRRRRNRCCRRCNCCCNECNC